MTELEASCLRLLRDMEPNPRDRVSTSCRHSYGGTWTAELSKDFIDSSGCVMYCSKCKQAMPSHRTPEQPSSKLTLEYSHREIYCSDASCGCEERKSGSRLSQESSVRARIDLHSRELLAPKPIMQGQGVTGQVSVRANCTTFP